MHCAEAAICPVVQLFVWLKSPVVAMLETVSGPVPESVRSNEEGVPGVVMSWPAKVMAVADKVTAGVGVVPVPERAIVTGVFSAGVVPLEVIVKVPVLVPDAVGVKVTLSEQVAPLSERGDVQLLGDTWKSPEALAVMFVMPVEPIFWVYLAERDTAWDVDVLPMAYDPKFWIEVGVVIS